ncbi:(deoxy)nucleoside triphosphate pyrophosphohydrolase [Novosphingobium sp. RD2P27]|uniref:8-oxo-dGTP diphosphatase n=1 Tax=Novosphingobium kalidii TaxID=3230299 RepID=A0ABV2D2U0_9SPHN
MQHLDRAEPLWVSAVALIDAAGRVLMQRRPLGAVHGGLWEFPGGKLEPCEAPEVAAARELQEELGLVTAPTDLVPAAFASGRTDGRGDRPLIIMLFVCTRWAGTPEPQAGASVGWYGPTQLAALAMPPLDYPLAEGLLKILQASAF